VGQNFGFVRFRRLRIPKLGAVWGRCVCKERLRAASWAARLGRLPLALAMVVLGPPLGGLHCGGVGSSTAADTAFAGFPRTRAEKHRRRPCQTR
jgi:hypothetical protein